MPNIIDAIIIDDEPQIIELCSSFLEDLGVFRNIISAEDGVTASNKISNQEFGLIVLDVNLPKKSGIDIIQKIKTLNPKALSKILLISGELDKMVLSQAISHGVKHFLVKPFDRESFLEKVSSILQSH